MQHGGELMLEEGKRYIIDVGSVGQPRDLNPQPCFVRYDPDARRVEWIRYEYPIAEVQSKMRDRGASALSRRSFERRPMSDVPFDDGNCFACGPSQSDRHARAFRSRRRMRTASSRVSSWRRDYQGWRGIAHGGIVMALLDEAMAHAAGFAGHRGVTASVNVRFRKPVPLERADRGARSRDLAAPQRARRRGDVLDDDGNVLAHAEGSFVSRGRLDAADDRRNPCDQRRRNEQRSRDR